MPDTHSPAGQIETGPELRRARYRDPSMAAPEAWNPVLSLLLNHRSTRRFLPDGVSDDMLASIVAAAQSAPTSSNLQLWSVVAVRDAGRRARLAELAGSQAHVRDCPLFLVFLADQARADRIAAAQGRTLGGGDYLEAFMVALVDAALAAQNAVVALESLGLGSVYIGGMRNHPEKVAAELNLPPHAMACFGLCVGWPDPAEGTDIKPRLPQAAVLHHEGYALPPGEALPAEVAQYDAALQAFQQEQGMRVQDWSAIMANRLRGPESLSGRHRMREALGNLGFQLR